MHDLTDVFFAPNAARFTSQKKLSTVQQGTEMATKLTPGTPAPSSAQYRNNTTGYEVTGIKGKPLPPTPRPGQTYTLVDLTKHKSGR